VTAVPEFDQQKHSPTAPPRRPDEADRGVATQHPLLELQQQAGNAAVSRLIAIQRHTLDPDEEAG
jgi:hypothetical protein